MNETLTINNIDSLLLDKQRAELWGLLHYLQQNDISTKEQDDALEGVLNMLDHWSDNRADLEPTEPLQLASMLASDAVANMGDIFFDPQPSIDGDIDPTETARLACYHAIIEALSVRKLPEPQPLPTLQPVTVLLLYPDYLAVQYGEDTYLAHIEAATTEEAVKLAQQEVWAQGESDEGKPEDFAVLFACPGHQMDLAVELHN